MISREWVIVSPGGDPDEIIGQTSTVSVCVQYVCMNIWLIRLNVSEAQPSAGVQEEKDIKK